jgi:hypothetical protein
LQQHARHGRLRAGAVVLVPCASPAPFAHAHAPAPAPACAAAQLHHAESQGGVSRLSRGRRRGCSSSRGGVGARAGPAGGVAAAVAGVPAVWTQDQDSHGEG